MASIEACFYLDVHVFGFEEWFAIWKNCLEQLLQEWARKYYFEEKNPPESPSNVKKSKESHKKPFNMPSEAQRREKMLHGLCGTDVFDTLHAKIISLLWGDPGAFEGSALAFPALDKAVQSLKALLRDDYLGKSKIECFMKDETPCGLSLLHVKERAETITFGKSNISNVDYQSCLKEVSEYLKRIVESGSRLWPLIKKVIVRGPWLSLRH